MGDGKKEPTKARIDPLPVTHDQQQEASVQFRCTTADLR